MGLHCQLSKKLYMHIFVSLIFCVCLHCPLQVSGGDCWLQSHPGTLVINQPSFCLPPHSLPLHLFFMFIFIVLCSDSAVCLPALQTWCTRSSVAYLSSRPVVVLVVVLSQSIKYMTVTSISELATRSSTSCSIVSKY